MKAFARQLSPGLALMAALLYCAAYSSPALAAADFSLWYVDHTGIEIAIAWAPVPGATAYVVWRDTADTFNTPNLISYAISPTVSGLGDTGWPLTDWRRFHWRSNPADSPIYHLDVGASYYYQVVAQTPAGARTSNIIGPYQIADYHNPSEIVRGVPGDLWADVVLGKPSFAENTWLKTDPYHVQFPGGVTVDKNSSQPTHVFLVDSNHNRVLGVEALGHCSSSQAPCSIDADCGAGQTCTLLPGQMGPAFVLGQPSATDSGACNGDATVEVYPNSEPPTASTVCFMRRDQISTGETEISIQPAVDRNHNLYLPDVENHRVLMYKNPFDPANGTAAFDVWGQNNFQSGNCNKGSYNSPTMSTLCYPNSVDIDAAGNLWVSDAGEPNSRVLRFPYNAGTGQIAKTADLALTGLWHPSSVRVDPSGNVYVSDSSGVRKFANPQPGGTNAFTMLTFISQDPDYTGANQLAFDPVSPTHLWILISSPVTALYDVAHKTLLKKVHSGHMRGLDVSQVGDLFTTEMWDHTVGLYRLGASQTPPQYTPGDPAFLGYGVASNDSLHSVIGITTAGNQLLVSDRYHVHFWNDYHAITQGGSTTLPSDGMWGPEDWGWVVKSDTTGRIWIDDAAGRLQIFQGPLTSTSTPIKSVQVSSYKDTSGAIVPWPTGTLGIWNFIPAGSGDQMWFTDDPGSSRVLRAVNIDGLETPGQPPYVDIVLGQPDAQSRLCNQGRGTFAFARDTLCYETTPVMDSEGNLYVQDNASGGMDGGDTRLLRWNAATIPANPATTVFDLLPDSVYGGGGPTGFTAPPSSSGDPVYPYPINEIAQAPRAPAFDSSGRLVFGGGNPYGAPRFGMAYLNRDQNYEPQLALGDFVSFPSASYIDPDGNLYLGDYDWCRVLVYKAPFAQFSGVPYTPPATSTSGPTATPTPTSPPTLTPTAGYCTSTLWADNPLAEFHLGEASGPVMNDATGNRNNGAYSATGITYLQPPLTTDPSSAVSFASGSAYVLNAPAALMAYTVEAWIKPTTISAQNILTRTDASTAGNAWSAQLRINAAGLLEHYLWDTNGAELVTSSTVLQSGSIYHVVGTAMNSGLMHLYVNGSEEGSAVSVATMWSGTQWALADRATTAYAYDYFNGSMDEVAIYDTQLSGDRVSAHYQACAFPMPAPTTTASAPTTPATTPTETPTLTPTPTVCTITTPGQTAWQRAQVRVSRINDGKSGNETLLVSGQFAMATGRFSVDPIANGAQIVVRAWNGNARLNATLPGGAYQYPQGWLKNRTGTRYTFINKLPTSTQWISTMTIVDRGGGAVWVSARVPRGYLDFLPTDGPVTLTVILGGAASSAAGECGQATFMNCKTNRVQTNLICGL